MRFLDYLTMRTPPPRLGASTAAQPGKISTARVIISIAGLFLGIVASFVVTGITPNTDPTKRIESTSVAGDKTKPPDLPTGQSSSAPRVELDLSWGRMRTVGLIGLVICCLTYQGLYFSLRLYEHQPGLLIFFVSFQYGYFWQSVVDGARTVLKS